VLKLRGGGDHDCAEALESICTTYWFPLYAFARRTGHSPHDAQDLTQEFFKLLLRKHWLSTADPRKGRLRAFLVTAFKRFMTKEWRRLSAQRRGRAQTHFSLDTEFAESHYAADISQQLDPDAMFDRQWALRLLELTMDRLREEFSVSGKSAEFDVLKELLTLPRDQIDYASAAARLGITPANARVCVHRLRKRFREIYREEVSQTLPDGESLDDEMSYLARVLSGT
jgi:RNA polymerase sigma-70 factor (ECF subfamily)